MISCSSDLTVKVSVGIEQYVLGTHNDSVTCLSALDSQSIIASGGLDKKIRIWDLNASKMAGTAFLLKLAEIELHSSVYAIASSCCIVASATSVGNTVKLYDTRSNKEILELQGHQDMVRTIQMRYSGHLIIIVKMESIYYRVVRIFWLIFGILLCLLIHFNLLITIMILFGN